MSDFRTEAILLRKIDYGDHDFIITFITRDRGKITVMAKNAKKSVKRFSGSLDLFSLNHILCSFPKKNKDAMVTLAHADLENGFANIRFNVFKTAYASYWAEMTHLWMEEGRTQPKLYDLLLFALDMLDRSDIQKEVLSLLFQIRFMSISGFTPNMEMCENCNTLVDNIPEKKLRFDFKEGKIVCPRCRVNGSKYGMDVSKGTLKQLFWMNNTDICRADRIRFSGFAIKEGQMLLESFIPFHIGREFKSLMFLKRLRQEQWI
ncbi:MAG: DNA repair protein RecO [Desulfotignum sp.]|nr:DNA repair protein RecO [Desulfotignum sp.]MCF8113158.1 DNA repair protein RecO [Desulfotignum sp.]MCF8125853.1 DNA repair protein RecO [Desulfotignum sp.]